VKLPPFNGGILSVNQGGCYIQLSSHLNVKS
jgi:hypothetical protein